MRRIVGQANAGIDGAHSVGERTAARHDQQSACAPEISEHTEDAIELLGVLQQASADLDDEVDALDSAFSNSATAAAGA